jgi:hypothetical protein
MLSVEGVSGPDTLEKVLEKLATTEKSTIVIERAPEGKIRVTSGSWEGEKVILKGQVPEIRNVDGRQHIDDENSKSKPAGLQNYGSPECAHHR